jgi:hypothetical protein
MAIKTVKKAIKHLKANGIYIPPNVATDQDLDYYAKVLFGVLASLADHRGIIHGFSDKELGEIMNKAVSSGKTRITIDEASEPFINFPPEFFTKQE